MEFIALTDSEAESINICWSENIKKSQEIISAALEAGFSEEEIIESPLGILEQDHNIKGIVAFNKDSKALIGANGLILIQVA